MDVQNVMKMDQYVMNVTQNNSGNKSQIIKGNVIVWLHITNLHKTDAKNVHNNYIVLHVTHKQLALHARDRISIRQLKMVYVNAI